MWRRGWQRRVGACVPGSIPTLCAGTRHGVPHLQLHNNKIFIITWNTRKNQKSSVADPDPKPSDPYVFRSPGSGSSSQRYGSGSGSFYHQANLDSYCFVTSFWLFIFEKWYKYKVSSKSNKQKYFLKNLFFVGVLIWRKKKDPVPLVRGMGPRIHTKMSWICNTAGKKLTKHFRIILNTFCRARKRWPVLFYWRRLSGCWKMVFILRSVLTTQFSILAKDFLYLPPVLRIRIRDLVHFLTLDPRSRTRVGKNPGFF